jgi:hypothetical protein
MSEVLAELKANIVSTERSIAADKSHHKSENDPRLVEKRQNVEAMRLELHVRRALASAPRPSDKQLAKIAALLTAGGGPDAAA